MLQTSIILHYGPTEILVRVYDQHVSPDMIAVDSRPSMGGTWQPFDKSNIELRMEGSP